jgi:ribosomal protein S18 acetylase RimI-like enzyme
MPTKSLQTSRIDVRKSIDLLFALELKIANATPALLQLKTKEKLLGFLTDEPNSSTWLWKDQSGKIVGYLTLIDKPEEEAMEVLAIRVDPEFHGTGYGKQMMEFTEKMAVELGRKKVALVTNTKNLRAIGFYKGLGYEVVEEIENYFGDGEARYLFEKNLT